MPNTLLLKEKFFIDKNSYIPIYIQLKDILRGLIRKKKLKPDQKIPSENELSAELKISRMTVRQAIKELEKEGFIYVRKGEGTFVGRIQDTQMLIKLDGFSREMQKLGYKVHSKVLEVKTINSSDGKFDSAYSGLNEAPDGRIVAIKRLRYIEKRPFAVETSFLRHKTGHGLLERDFSRDFSIYEYIENGLGIKLSRAEHTIEPGLAKEDIVDLLKIEEGDPVLFIKGTTFSGRGQPVEYLEGTYRGNEYKLKVGISR